MPLSTLELIQKIKEMQTPDKPLLVEEKADKVILTYNLVDTNWIKILGAAGLKDIFQLEVTFDEATHTAKFLMQQGTVSWSAGIPTMHFSASGYRGQQYGFHTRKAWGVKNDGTIGQIYNYTINYNSISSDLQKVVESAGWKLKRNWSDPSTVVALIAVIIAVIGILFIPIFKILNIGN